MFFEAEALVRSTSTHQPLACYHTDPCHIMPEAQASCTSPRTKLISPLRRSQQAYSGADAACAGAGAGADDGAVLGVVAGRSWY